MSSDGTYCITSRAAAKVSKLIYFLYPDGEGAVRMVQMVGA